MSSGVQLEKAHGGDHAIARLVHESLRQQQTSFLAVNYAFGEQAIKFFLEGREIAVRGDLFHGHETDIVAVLGIVTSGISETDN